MIELRHWSDQPGVACGDFNEDFSKFDCKNLVHISGTQYADGNWEGTITVLVFLKQ